MPQLDTSTFASQIFWLIVVFGALYYVLSRHALPRVASILQTRQERIAADLNQAQQLRLEAEQAMARYDEVIGAAQADAHAIAQATQAKLQAETAERLAALDARLATQVSEAEARIAAAKTAALQDLEEAAVTAAQAATERLAGLKVTKKDAQAALQAVTREAA